MSWVPNAGDIASIQQQVENVGQGMTDLMISIAGIIIMIAVFGILMKLLLRWFNIH